ncbi:MAG: hypothetical protein ABSB82_09710 [Terriglobia bacterium]
MGTPRAQLKAVERALLESGWMQVREDVEAKLVSVPGGRETYVLCRSQARRAKEKTIRSSFSQRLEKALGNLQQQVEKGRLKNHSKIERRLGKIQARHPRVADLYEMSVGEWDGHPVAEWKRIEERRAWRDAREGAYLLRTNLQGETAEELWKKYLQLTEAETAFRVLKSEPSIRPLFHQLERWVKAHILVAFLGCALWVTLKHLLQGKNNPMTPARALALLAGVHSADVLLPTTDGREIGLRRVTTPSPEQNSLLALLAMNLPERLDLNFECSVNSATG